MARLKVIPHHATLFVDFSVFVSYNIHMTKLEQHITDYISELEERKGRSVRTVRNYDFYLRRFATWLRENKVRSIEKFDEKDLEKYKRWLSQYQDPIRKVILKTTTQNYHLIALRGFLEYLYRIKVDSLKYNHVKLVKLVKKQIVFLEKDELVELLEAPHDYDQDKIIKRRDKAILELLFSTGLKVSEVSGLQIAQLKPSVKKLEKLKTSATDEIKLSNQAIETIKKYLSVRKDSNKNLFIGHDRAINNRKKVNGLSPRSIERIIEKYAKFISLKKPVSPQVIRHTFVINQIMRGADIEKLRIQLGFNDLNTLKAYINRF